MKCNIHCAGSVQNFVTNMWDCLLRSPGESEESRNPLPFKKRKEDPQGGTKPEHRDHSKAATENDPREGVPVQQPQSKGNREREKGAVAQEKVKGKVVHVRQPQRKGNRETEKGAVAQENVKGKVVPVRQPPSKGNQEEEKGEMAQENRDPSCGYGAKIINIWVQWLRSVAFIVRV